MRYTDFMIVGIDTGVLCCEDCGALVPHDRRIVHNEHHNRLARAEAQETQA
jgi:hypothetical protein